MSLNGQPCDNPVTTTRQTSDNGVTLPVGLTRVQLTSTPPTVGTVGVAHDGVSIGIPHALFALNPYSDHAPAQLPFSLPATPDALPPPLNIDLDALRADRERARLRAEANAMLLETARFDAQADADQREAHDIQLRHRACQRCKARFEVKVGKKRRYCGRKGDEDIIGREDCVKEQDAIRQRNYRARKNAQRQN